MKTRIISGAVLIVLLVIVIAFGGPVLAAGLTIFTLRGLYEFYRAVNLVEKGKPVNALTLPGYICTPVIYFSELLFLNDLKYLVYILAFLCIVLLSVYVFAFPKYRIDSVAYAFFGVMYVPLMFSFMFLIRQLEGGIYLVWLVFIASSICDMFAYFVGMAIGKHKLAPNLSPKKTIEGSIGGTFFATLIAGVYGYFISDYVTFNANIIVVFTIVTLLGSIVSQVGDLAASGIKRNVGIKDFGKIIPGHGGVVDRIDSIIFAAAICYIICIIFTR